MADQAGFEFALMKGLFEGEEIENVGVFEELLGQVGMGGGEGLREVGDGGVLATMGLRLNHAGEGVAAPSVGEGLLYIPEPDAGIFDHLHQQDIVSPRQLGNRRLPNWHRCIKRMRVFAGELNHQFKVAFGEPFEFRHFASHVPDEG